VQCTRQFNINAIGTEGRGIALLSGQKTKPNCIIIWSVDQPSKSIRPIMGWFTNNKIVKMLFDIPLGKIVYVILNLRHSSCDCVSNKGAWLRVLASGTVQIIFQIICSLLVSICPLSDC
jgi:hypothetical protein